MNKIREILRLSESNLSQRQISRSLNISIGTVHKYLALIKEAGLSWPIAQGMNDKTLRSKLFPDHVKQNKHFSMPDFEWIHREMKQKGVTMALLHDEYRANNPISYYSYRRFCELYRRWKKDRKICLLQEYKAGDKMFVDYAGQTIPITDPQTGNVQQAQIFVAVLAVSNYTYAEASLDQRLDCWLNSHVRTFEYFGGVPNLIIPDNLKSGVNKACRYEPDLNPNYCALAKHYDTAVLPTRPYRPQDKGKVENAVLNVER